MTAWLAAFLLFLVLGAIALAGVAGYRLAYARMRKQAGHANELAARLIREWRHNETVAGAFALALSADRDPAALIGVENCYYHPPDFTRVTWVAREMPTPFVGCAPMPGPLASGFINNMQFRYAREIEVPKPPRTVRIFVTGGSTAFGVAATGNETTIGGYLEKYLNDALAGQHVRCEVVTAAACAWGSTQERILIENRLIELDPDIVISFSGHNDAFWAISGRNILWFRVFQDDYFFTLVNAALAFNTAEEFPRHHPGGGSAVSAGEATQRLVRNVAFAHHALATVGADYVFALQPVLEVSKKIRTPREQRVAAAVGHTPWFVQMDSFYRDFRKALQALERPRLYFADVSTVFDACDDQVELFIDTAHFGDRGNDLIARRLRGQILEIIKKRLAASDQTI
jgi:lysophospholipase L1-like esterase